MTKPTTQDIANFAERIQTRVNAFYAARYGNLEPPTIEVSPQGRKYKRIFANHFPTRRFTKRMVVCFVDAGNGDVLKASSWKAPAPHSRGNIFDDSLGMDAISESGTNARYL